LHSILLAFGTLTVDEWAVGTVAVDGWVVTFVTAATKLRRRWVCLKWSFDEPHARERSGS